MKESEAIKWQKQIGVVFKGFPLDIEEKMNDSCDMAMQALEKQIPKKIEIRKATNDDIESELRDFITVKGRICRCPSCRCCIHISELKYCWECGQKLDWSDID